jgi:hypothetical protein
MLTRVEMVHATAEAPPAARELKPLEPLRPTITEEERTATS